MTFLGGLLLIVVSLVKIIEAIEKLKRENKLYIFNKLYFCLC